MTETLEAVFDGMVFRPKGEVHLEPNTEVEITVTTIAKRDGEPGSFLKTALRLNVDGPADFSTRIDEYLYGERDPDEK